MCPGLRSPTEPRRPPDCSRRQFLLASAAVPVVLAGAGTKANAPRRRLRVAAVYTVFRQASHAFCILENFLEPYLFNGRRIDPGMDIVSFYADQTAREGDLTQDVARRYRIPVYRSIAEALCVGGRELAVDAVLAIGEHGTYPVNQLGQVEYPRKRFFDESVAVMRRSRRFVPLFTDKHLSYRWDWAREMYDTSRRLGIPLMAGSAVPLAQRRPALELPATAAVAEAVSIHGSGVESYDFHGLEVLQSLVESRRGGETGVARVEFFQGAVVEQELQVRPWARALVHAAMEAEYGKGVHWDVQIRRERAPQPHAIFLTYRDGLRAAVLNLGGNNTRWNFACKWAGDARLHATRFYAGPWGNRNLFPALAHAIQHHFRHREAPYPVERTLLTTGIVEAAMRSRAARRPIETPHLHIAYAARDFGAMRERGASWQVITDRTPEPAGLNPGARQR